jgi:thymidylate synthase
MTQYAWAYNSLVNDKDSRQAVIHFNLPTHQYDGNKDFVCTMYGIFQIRNNKLNFTISMRSNDAILGLPTDVAFFCTLQQQMLVHLKPTYPELELGEYTHIANSLHIYENNFKVVEEMLNEDFTQEEMPIVKESLINKNGSPAFALNNLLNNRSDASYSNSDEVYSWIHKKINKL